MIKVINLSIDGKPIKAKEGSHILEVALDKGIEVPHLCHQSGLSSTGACRVCLVKVKGRPELITSCTTEVSQGTEIITKDEEIIKARRLMVELILSEREHNCLICEKNGDCELQDLVYQLGIDNIRFPVNKRVEKTEDSSQVILRDPNKCILCGRCVRACAEITVQDVLDLAERGGKTFIAAGLDEKLADTDCVSCGACVQACPTGALTEKLARFQGRSWEFRKVETTCPYCGVGCQIELNIKNDRIVKVYGVDNGSPNRGHLCVKGRFGLDYVHHQERLTTPMIKKKGRFIEVSWEEALELVAHRFKELKDKYGSDSLAGLSSAKCTNEENYLFQKFIRVCFGNNSVDHCARLCHASTVAGLGRAFGSGAMTNSIREWEKSDVVLVTGSNTTEAHPVIGYYLKHLAIYQGLKLIVIDPRAIELTQYAKIWLRQENGTDVAWINGLMNIIVQEGLYDEGFVENRTENFNEFEKIISRYTPQKVEEITGIPEKELIAAARMYASGKRSSIVFSMGITQHTTGTDNVLSLANLAMLCGNVGREGTGVNPLRGQNNVQGACDLGALPNVYPGYQKVTDEQIRQKFEKAWNARLSPKEGLTAVEMIEAAKDGVIKGLYIMGENPMLSDPNLNNVREGLENLDFLVVQDIFLTETARLADVVLPGVSFAEKNGTFTNTERRVQRVHKALPEIGDSRQDWQIILELSRRMGYSMSYNSAGEIMEEIASLTPIYGGIRFDRLSREALQWPCPSSDHPGTPYLHKDKFTRGKGFFTPINYIPPAELPDKEYPFLLSTGRILYHFHTGSLSRRSKPLDSIVPEGFLEMNPVDAKRLKIKDSDWVNVSSRRGKVKTKVKVTERTDKRAVFMSFHFAESAVNFLTNDALDPVAKIPEYKVSAVKIEKIE
ncbi:formate dehydrogenase subunit alpha [Candidatus Aerophobetes bacterium Ae_b3a]|nr:MAG: formate dehydrogenase subunit alpha [Candidatus Aerophobetes bacterium Ae_b3a]